MKIGIDLLLWTPFVTEEHYHLFAQMKECGYDGVEIPIFAGEEAHYRKIGRELQRNELDCTVVSVIPDEEHNPISSNPVHRSKAVYYLKHIIECCAALGAEVLCGPMYQPLGVFTGQGPSEDEKARAVEFHQTVAEFAGSCNLQIALEPLNRFECYFLNTLTDAARHAENVNHPNCGIMYDTFHGNIEEKDPAGCLLENGKWLKHIHISANDRGTPGQGHIPWKNTFKALKQIGYDNWLTIEAFGKSMPDELAATTKVWRELATSPTEVYTKGYELIKTQWENA